MELQTQDLSKAKRVARVIETIIRKCIKSDYRLPKSAWYLPGIVLGIKKYQELCYPMGLADGNIVDYLLYQLYRTRDIVPQTRWSISWLFTDNAIKKYQQQFQSKEGKSGIKYYIDEWMSDNRLRFQRLTDLLKDPSQHPMMPYLYMPSEEPIKRRWLNTQAGLMLCVNNTTGWCPQSPTCQKCKNTEQCQIISQKTYPELIRLRKEISDT